MSTSAAMAPPELERGQSGFSSVRRRILAGSAILAIQFAATVKLTRSEYLPSPPPLERQIPQSVGSWQRVSDAPLDPDALAMLSPDDVMDRHYTHATSRANVGLFIAYYKTQHRSSNAHDPKVCLPGSGWNPVESSPVTVPVAGSAPIDANYYVVSRPPHESVVVYWYQNHDSTFANDQSLHFSRILDTVMKNRTDMALVRIIVPVTGDRAAAREHAVSFAQSIYPYVQQQFPAAPDRL